MIRLLRVLYLKHVKRRSLARLGVMPWWAERTRSTPIRKNVRRKR